MKREQIIKMTLNIIMTLLLITMFFSGITGIVYHEVIGVLIAICISAHLFLNRRWILGVTANIFKEAIKPRVMLLYVLNCITLISILGVFITGICISQVIFPQNKATIFLSEAHIWTAYSSLVLCAIHITFHIKYIIKFFKKLAAEQYAKKAWSLLSSIAVMAVVAGIVYNQIFAAQYEAAAVARVTPAVTEMISSDEQSAETEIKEETSITSDQSGDQQPVSVSLNDFLGKLYCTACRKHCSLLAPQCSKGEKQVREATARYEATYNITLDS